MASTEKKENIGTATSSAIERRQNLRFPFAGSVEITESKSGARVSGRVSDLGLGGCYIDAISAFPEGADVKVRVKRGNESFEAQAKVIYSQIGMGMGIAFVSAHPKQVRLFQQWLLEISGKIIPETDTSKQGNNEMAGAGLGDEKKYVLSELLTALIRKGVLTETEGRPLLKILLR